MEACDEGHMKNMEDIRYSVVNRKFIGEKASSPYEIKY